MTVDETEEMQRPSFATIFSWTMVALPFASLAFPQLLLQARSLPANSSEQFAVVTALFVGNRMYLYAMSATIVALAALRGASDSAKLGERITDLTEELLFRPSLVDSFTDDISDEALGGAAIAEEKEKPAIIQSMSESGFGQTLDEVSSESQALILPISVSVLLAVSVFLLPLWNGPNPIVAEVPSFDGFAELQDILSKILPKISEVWNIGLLALFSRSEVRRLTNELIPSINDSEVDDSSVFATAEWVLAIGITLSAFLLQQWPAQNFVNMALAILVSRAIQLDKFTSVAAALSLLTIYDATSVFLIPAANAATTLLSDASASPATVGGSAMGSVAIQKLTSGTFQPGLLTTKIGNSLGGGLGLGDAVFPSILANFARRFDLHRNMEDDDRTSLFTVAMGGYLLGCFTCEFAPMISSSGIPALVFIVPAMMGSVLLAASLSGELEEFLEFKATASAHSSKNQ